MTLPALMEKHGISQTDLARELGVLPSAINHRLAGRRRWWLDEAHRVLAYMREKTSDDSLTLDSLFGQVRKRRPRKAA